MVTNCNIELDQWFPTCGPQRSSRALMILKESGLPLVTNGSIELDQSFSNCGPQRSSRVVLILKEPGLPLVTNGNIEQNLWFSAHCPRRSSRSLKTPVQSLAPPGQRICHFSAGIDPGDSDHRSEPGLRQPNHLIWSL